MLNVFQFTPDEQLLTRTDGWTDFEVRTIILPRLQMYNPQNNANNSNANNVEKKPIQSLMTPRTDEQDSLEELK